MTQEEHLKNYIQGKPEMIRLTQEQAEAVFMLEMLKRENVIKYFGDLNEDFKYARDWLKELGVEIEGEGSK